MKTNQKLLILLLAISTVYTSCKKDEDTTPPSVLMKISITPQNQKVLIQWENPPEDDYEKTVIRYDGTSIEIGKEFTEALIENLINGQEYSFDLTTVDASGNASESFISKATPDKYVTKVQGQDIIPGTYNAVNREVPTEIILGETYFKNTIDAPYFKFVQEGSWLKENDTTITYIYEASSEDYSGLNHVADMVNSTGASFSYVFSDTTFYIWYVYEKVEGDDDFLPGKYSYYSKTFSDDDATFNDTTYHYVEYNENGTSSSYSSYDYNSITTGTWTNEDLLNGKYLFVSYNNKTYLVERDGTAIFAKQ